MAQTGGEEKYDKRLKALIKRANKFKLRSHRSGRVPE
jgi:hypothetical protein